MEDVTTLTPGQSLEAYNPPQFAARSLRIDNPTGCWYFLENNRQVIPPFTIGQIITLTQAARVINLRFLQTYAGQESKVIGNPLTIFLSDETLFPTNPVSVANAVPYTNTFFVWDTLTVAVDTRGFITIWPNVAMRIRLVSVDLSVNDSSSPGRSFNLQVYSIDSDQSGAEILTPVSRDGDPATVSQCTVKGMFLSAEVPTLLNRLDVWKWRIPAVEFATTLRAYNQGGPEMPPSAYSFDSTFRGLALVINAGVANPNLEMGIAWTEESINV